MAQTRPLANTKQSIDQGTDPGKCLIFGSPTLWGAGFEDNYCTALWRWWPSDFTLVPLQRWGTWSLILLPPSFSFPSPLWPLLVLHCEGSKHFPGTHALKFNILISPKHATCKYGCTVAFRIDISIGLGGRRLIYSLPSWRKKRFAVPCLTWRGSRMIPKLPSQALVVF